jgi:hypothetical protein
MRTRTEDQNKMNWLYSKYLGKTRKSDWTLILIWLGVFKGKRHPVTEWRQKSLEKDEHLDNV